MDIVELKNRIKELNNDHLRKYQFIGAEIKSNRIKMSKTLQSIANVNKSISYISKIENNKIIPNKESLNELCEELFISKEEMESMNNFDDELQNSLVYLFLDEKNNIKKIYERFHKFKNIRTNLMRGLYFCSCNDKDKLRRVVMDLEIVESNLNIDDYYIYVLLSVYNLIFNDNNVLAYKVVKTVLDMYQSEQIVCKLFNKLQFQLKTSMGLSTYKEDFHKTIKDHEQFCCSNEINKMVEVYNLSKIEFKNEENIIKERQFVKNGNVLFKMNLAIGDLKECGNLKESQTRNIDLLLYYYKLQSEEDVDNLINFGELSNEELIIANYYKLKIRKDYEELKNYIVNIVLPFYYKKGNVPFLIELFKELNKINAKFSKYKETSIISMKIFEIIEDIINITG